MTHINFIGFSSRQPPYSRIHIHSYNTTSRPPNIPRCPRLTVCWITKTPENTPMHLQAKYFNLISQTNSDVPVGKYRHFNFHTDLWMWKASCKRNNGCMCVVCVCMCVCCMCIVCVNAYLSRVTRVMGTSAPATISNLFHVF